MFGHLQQMEMEKMKKRQEMATTMLVDKKNTKTSRNSSRNTMESKLINLEEDNLDDLLGPQSFQ